MTTEEIFTKLLEASYPSGSRVYGVCSPLYSDYDYIISKKSFQNICGNVVPVGFINKYGSEYTDLETEMVSYKYDRAGKCYNFIVLINDDLYERYKRATNCLSSIKPVRDKELRISLFHFFRDHKVEGF